MKKTILRVSSSPEVNGLYEKAGDDFAFRPTKSLKINSMFENGRTYGRKDINIIFGNYLWDIVDEKSAVLESPAKDSGIGTGKTSAAPALRNEIIITCSTSYGRTTIIMVVMSRELSIKVHSINSRNGQNPLHVQNVISDACYKTLIQHYPHSCGVSFHFGKRIVKESEVIVIDVLADGKYTISSHRKAYADFQKEIDRIS